MPSIDYEKRVQEWIRRAKEERDNYVKFILFYISLEVSVKLKSFSKIRDIKRDTTIKQRFFSKIDENIIKKLKQVLNKNPLKNMKPNGDCRWKGKLKSENLWFMKGSEIRISSSSLLVKS